MMKRFLLIILLLMLLPAALQAQETETSIEQPSQPEGWVKTLIDADIRACPELACEVLYTYTYDALFPIWERTTGDPISGNEEWLLVRHHLTGEEGYIPARWVQPHEPEDWQTRPVIPTLSDNARAIYQRGIEAGNNPGIFTIVGDCQTVPSFFMGVFDKPDEYVLGPFDHLQPTIDQFAGSFSRDHITVDNGYNVASVLSPIWSDPTQCEGSENPLECEYRLQKPSIAIVSMETWWGGRPAEEYEAYLREIVDYLLEQNVLPILATKADNLERDHGLNAAVVRVADEYDLPLWNFWLAVQPIPGHGLTVDRFHLTFARNFFDDPERLERGWVVRNITALQALDAVWTAASEPASETAADTEAAQVVETSPDEAEAVAETPLPDADPGEVVETYLQAVIANDRSQIPVLVCPDWQIKARIDFDSFGAIEASLRDLSCASTGSSDGDQLVVCEGVIDVVYNGVPREVDLGKNTYRLRVNDEAWQVCGYE